MGMNILYLVVSNESDTYLEQTILSIESLRAVMAEVKVYVLIDKETKNTLQGPRKKLQDIADVIIVAETPKELDKRNVSRYLKTTMYQYMDSDFLFIDGDTIICSDLSDVPQDSPIAAVVDMHLKISECPLRNRLESYALKAGYRAGFEDKHFNSGVLWVKKCKESELFFEQWHNLWSSALQKGLIQDQTSFNEVNCRMNGIINELDGTWNCQMRRYGTGFQYLYNAKIIHYFASNAAGSVPYDLSNEKLLRAALSDTYPIELDNIMKEPKSAFRKLTYTIADADSAVVIESKAFELLKIIYQKNNKLYRALNSTIQYFSKMRKSMKRIK